jgi:transcriptional regulator with XRE-family HTH domain
MAAPSTFLAGLGHALREARADSRISQEELGLRTGVHRNYIGGIERGERNPSVTTVAALADALGLKMSELFARAEGGHPVGLAATRSS